MRRRIARALRTLASRIDPIKAERVFSGSFSNIEISSGSTLSRTYPSPLYNQPPGE